MGPNSVFVKMLICNICTTDYQQWDGKRDHMGFPMAAGHEWSGEVLAIGEKVNYFKVGDHVSMCGGGCGQCINCRMGRPSECLAPKGLHPMVNGYRGGRGFSSFNVYNENQLIKMNKELPAHICAFLEPVSAAVGGLRKLHGQAGEDIVVIGAGTMGMLNALVAHALGCRVIISEISEKKLKRARALGFADVINSKENDPVASVLELTDGVGADGVIPTVPLTSVYEQGYKMLKKHDGRFLVFAAGFPAPEMKIDPNGMHYSRAEIIGTIGGWTQDTVLAAKLINNKLVDPSFSWEGETYPLRDIQQAYTRAATPDMYRISVDLQGV
jgi:L-iditol 2-dehydrogenase